MEEKPLVSIITVSYNSEKTIRDTIKSVLAQTYSNIEYIIVDGSSIDNTVNIIKSFESEFEKRNISYKWISENDKGIADAWNKGLRLAKGGVISFLNSDDYYDSSSVNDAVKVLDVNKAEISYGVCKRINDNKQIIKVIQNIHNINKIYRGFTFSHTTCFNTRLVFDKIGNFDTSYKIAIDVDFLLRAINKEVVFKKANNITFMRHGGVSTKYAIKSRNEYRRALIKNKYKKTTANFQFLISIIIFYVYTLLKYVRIEGEAQC